MSNPEGQIMVDLYPEKSPCGVEIKSSRPVTSAQILIGKTPEQALSIIPLLFNICGIAQSHAAQMAIDQKLAKTVDPDLEAARDLLVLVETAREHLVRIFLDWPRLFELDYNNHKLPYLSQISKEFNTCLFDNNEAFTTTSQLKNDLSDVFHLIDKLDHFLEENIFLISADKWSSYQIDEIKRWWKVCENPCAKALKTIHEKDWSSQGIADSKPLPALDNNDLLKKFNDDDVEHFISQPDWDGQCFETTAYSRQYHHPLIEQLRQEFSSGLMTRWTARLTELAQIPKQIRSLLQQIKNKELSGNEKQTDALTDLGIAQVEAARGRLIHHVEIENNLIKKYQILAPTEWNFHPRGLLSQSLSSLRGKNKSELQQLTNLIINVFDPCVGYRYQVH